MSHVETHLSMFLHSYSVSYSSFHLLFIIISPHMRVNKTLNLQIVESGRLCYSSQTPNFI